MNLREKISDFLSSRRMKSDNSDNNSYHLLQTYYLFTSHYATCIS